MKTVVEIQVTIEGYHQYNEAPKEVNFLSSKHRHQFHIQAGYEVTDLNREKEIFIQRDILKDYLNEAFGIPCEFGNMSCEMIAKELIEFGQDDGMIWCRVWEESTGGAKVEL